MKNSLIKYFIFMSFLMLCQPSQAWFKKSPYKKALKENTRGEQLYQRPDFYASVAWTATKLDERFLQDLSDEIARVYDHTATEKVEYYRDNLKKFEGSTPFFVSFYTYERHKRDLTQKYPSWKVRLVVGHKRYDPVRVEKIAKPDVLQSLVFPYVKPWAEHYYIYFPDVTSPDQDGVALSVHGPHAKGQLVWK